MAVLGLVGVLSARLVMYGRPMFNWGAGQVHPKPVFGSAALHGAVVAMVMWGAIEASAQCTKDTDCKGTRICEAQKCVESHGVRPPEDAAPEQELAPRLDEAEQELAPRLDAPLSTEPDSKTEPPAIQDEPKPTLRRKIVGGAERAKEEEDEEQSLTRKEQEKRRRHEQRKLRRESAARAKRDTAARQLKALRAGIQAAEEERNTYAGVAAAAWGCSSLVTILGVAGGAAGAANGASWTVFVGVPAVCLGCATVVFAVGLGAALVALFAQQDVWRFQEKEDRLIAQDVRPEMKEASVQNF